MSSLNNKVPPLPPLVPISTKLSKTNANDVAQRENTSVKRPLPLLIPLASKAPLKRGVNKALDEPVVIMPAEELLLSLEPQVKEDAFAEQRLVIDLAELETLEEAMHTEEIVVEAQPPAEPPAEPPTDPPEEPASASIELPVTTGKQCGHCDSRLSNLAELKCHETHKHGIKHFWTRTLEKYSSVNFVFVCDICRMLLPNLKALTAHKKNHAPPKVQYVRKCYMCIKYFYSRTAWEKHCSTHKPDDPINRVTKCPICNKENVRNMILHMRSHSTDRRILCNECGMTMKNSVSFRQHQERHLKELKYKCDDCPRRFVAKGDLYSHRMSVHIPHKHVCTDCNRTFPRPNMLRKHNEFYHSDDHPPYNCDRCDKSFDRRSSLVFHRRQHRGIKPKTQRRNDPYLRASTIANE
ncbi:zinc finger protein 668-like isoform X1 [Drosophila sulfurigaster albostrigata]|uniref:zinc finger protein 668-like isoform X1 n=1 Tax=Drosophila sulfurigaster albostrigata TaxID=89887 RepID=UPI002D21B2C2|nr:zinc finger protein 668-like isoform X1 [Drosophila sulfurigaster albostrigata]